MKAAKNKRKIVLPNPFAKIGVKKFLLRTLNIHIRKNSRLTQWLFGVKIGYNNRIQWDFTTIILKRCLKAHVVSSHRILEMGSGPFALLSIFLQSKYTCAVDACDINDRYVDSALKCIKLNHGSVTVVKSDLFETITGDYDIIFFNSVYIPTERGIADGIDKLHDHTTDWCGGRDGTETIRKFLIDAQRHLAPGGKVLLGFNKSYLKEAVVKQMSTSLGYTVTDTCSFPLYPSEVLILKL